MCHHMSCHGQVSSYHDLIAVQSRNSMGNREWNFCVWFLGILKVWFSYCDCIRIHVTIYLSVTISQEMSFSCWGQVAGPLTPAIKPTLACSRFHSNLQFMDYLVNGPGHWNIYEFDTAGINIWAQGYLLSALWQRSGNLPLAAVSSHMLRPLRAQDLTIFGDGHFLTRHQVALNHLVGAAYWPISLLENILKCVVFFSTFVNHLKMGLIK